ncbi:MAG: hypothetical protein AB8G18_14130 [Gammaproteobacteria bacterium]
MNVKKALVFGASFIVLGCGTPSVPDSKTNWDRYEQELLDIVDGKECGLGTTALGFCSSDVSSARYNSQIMGKECKGDPVTYLRNIYEASSATEIDRAKSSIKQALQRDYFATPLPNSNSERLIEALYHRDQALRFLKIADVEADRNLMDSIKWVTICGHAYFAKLKIDSYLDQHGFKALENDKDFAKKAWILIQHSDFDPDYQLRRSDQFAQSPHTHMKKFAGYLKDRGLVGLGKEQVCGTQLTCINGERAPFATSDRRRLNERRLSLGMTTIEERLAKASRCRK